MCLYAEAAGRMTLPPLALVTESGSWPMQRGESGGRETEKDRESIHEDLPHTFELQLNLPERRVASLALAISRGS